MMNKTVNIEIWNQHVRYNLELKHRVTIVTGFSGIGKTVLVNMIENIERYDVMSGIEIRASVDWKKLSVLKIYNLEKVMKYVKKAKVYFIDGGRSNEDVDKALFDLLTINDAMLVYVTRYDKSEYLKRLDYGIYTLKSQRNNEKIINYLVENEKGAC